MERHEFYKEMQKSIKSHYERIDKKMREKPEITWDEAMDFADIVKDLTEAEKNLAKAHYYYCEHSDERL